MNPRRALLVLVCLTVFALLPGCVSGWQPGRTATAVPTATAARETRPERNQRLYDIVWEAVRRHYYDGGFNGADWPAARERHRQAAVDAPDDDALFAVIHALLGELRDKHTYARTAAHVAERARTEGVVVGLVTAPSAPDDPRRVVLDTMPGGAAATAGVEPGWILVSCDGRAPATVLGVGRLRVGQIVRCIFLDAAGSERAIDLEARRLSLGPVRRAHVLEGGWLHLRFDRFDLDTARWVRRTLKAHAGAPGIVVDLRQNPGGESVALARSLGEFFPHAVPMGSFVRRGGEQRSLRASPGWRGVRYRGPVAVLVSENSGSSAEIFAHVMQHSGRGVIVGTRTAGAVLGGVVGALRGGGDLQISVRDYRGVDGRRLEGAGVEPDIEVTTKPEDRSSGRDPVLDAALAHLRGAVAR